MSAATPIKMYPVPNDNPGIVKDIQENYQTGHVKIYRSLKKHWLWKASRKKSKLEAWLDLLMLAAFEDTKEPFGYDLIMLKRGQLLTSQDRLSKEWLWDRSAVRLFLKQLEDDAMIQVNATAKYTMITICKYASYHSLQPSKQQVDNNRTTTGQHIQEFKEFKELEEDNKGGKPPKKIFVIPSVEDLTAFIASITENHPNSELVAKNVFNFYQSKDWKVGKSKMKDWQASARNSLDWEKNQKLLQITVATSTQNGKFAPTDKP